MTREIAAKLCHEELIKNGLNDWHVRFTSNPNSQFLAMCLHKDSAIIINTHFVETNADDAVIDVIKHEVAHALTPGHAHDEVWAAKAREIGCQNTLSCPGYSMPAHVIDAIRSGADVKIEFETETHVTHRPKYEITRLQDKCPTCGKVARTEREVIIESKNETPDKKYIFLECGDLIIKELPKGTPFGSLVSNWWKPEVTACAHEWVINRCAKCNESKLFPFQIEGAQFLETGLASQNGAAVFDEMGLGKTIQCLSYLKFHPEEYPVLFVVKSGIKFQWFKEIFKWLGPSCIGQVIETSKDIVMPGLNVYIVSYDVFTKKERKLKSGKISSSGRDYKEFDFIKTVAMDEVQQIKNPDAARTQQIRKLVRGKKLIALSGTPWKNRGSEYFTILNMLAPMKFPTYQGFLDRWVQFYYDGEYMKQGGIKNIERFREYVKDIAIRREVKDVEVQMPDVNRTLHFAELDDVEQKTYDHEESEFVKWFNDKIIGGEEDEVSDMNILAEMSRMRHITGLAKIPATEAYVEEFYESTDRKLVIFVHHIDVGDILFQNLHEKYTALGIDVYQLTGAQSPMERFQIAEKFQASKRAFCVASTQAAGEGINLQTCGDAILHERQWNPQNEDQAAPGRFRRIGSSHSVVNVTFMTAAGTIDEILAGIVERKRAYFHNAMNSGELVESSGKSLAMELAEALVKNQKEKSRIARMASPMKRNK